MAEISVLMPAYNSSEFIKEAINSILNQTFSDFELIIVNDGSTDNTHQIISAFSDARIKYYQNDSNKGLAYVRNRLIELSTSDYIAFLDSDDIAEKERLEIQYNFFKQQKSLGLIAASVHSINENGKLEHTNWKFNLNENELPVHLLFYNPIVTSTVMFKKELLPNEVFRSDYPPCEDYDLWVKMLFNSKGIVLSDFLATYRLYYNSVSKRKADDARNNRNRVIVDQLEYYFPNQYSDQEAQLHLSLVEFSLKNKIEDLPALQSWIQKFITLNQQHHHFNEKILKQVLYERVLKKYLRLTEYNLSVYQKLIEVKKILQPTLTFALRKKELAILAFSIVRKKFIQL